MGRATDSSQSNSCMHSAKAFSHWPTERILIQRWKRSEIGGLSLRLRPGPEIDRISVEGRIASSVYRTLDEKDGLYAWGAQFGFWVTREYLSAAIRKVTWVEHFAGQDVVKVP